MLNSREFAYIILVSLEIFFTILATIFLVILINIFAKKVVAFHYDSEIEINLWEIKRWGFKTHYHFKKPFPAGVFFPVIITFLSYGFLYWMGNIVFEVKAKAYRAAKRWGLYTFSEMTEWHIGLIAASGIVANLLFAVIGYLIGFADFARLNIYYAFFNMLPISDLDGNKIFFGSLTLWSFLAIVVLIALGYAFFLV